MASRSRIHPAPGEARRAAGPVPGRCLPGPSPGRLGGGAGRRGGCSPVSAGLSPSLPPSFLPSLGSPRPGHVVGRQPQHHAAAGGAAEAGGGRGEDQGLSGGCRAPAVLYAKCLQRCLACWGSCGEQSLSRAPLLCSTLKTREGHQSCLQARHE